MNGIERKRKLKWWHIENVKVKVFGVFNENKDERRRRMKWVDDGGGGGG